MCEQQTAIYINESRSLICLSVLNLTSTKCVKNKDLKKLAKVIYEYCFFIASYLGVKLTSVEQISRDFFYKIHVRKLQLQKGNDGCPHRIVYKKTFLVLSVVV